MVEGGVAMMTLMIILIAIFIIGLLLCIDYKLGRKKHRSAVKHIDFPFRKSNLHIFTHGPQLFDDLFFELKKAKKHIHVQLYICKNDPISKEFLSILKDKAKEGVEVRLLLDRIGSRSIKRKMIAELKRKGVEFAFSHALKLPYLFYSSQTRNHRKVTIIDGSIGYTGGYNVGKEYIDLDPVLSPWRDYHLKMTGEGVKDLQHQFLIDWFHASGSNLLRNEQYYPKLTEGKYTLKILSTEGFFLEETFSNLIKKAKTSITIGSPYFIPSKKVFRDLLEALDRGVSLTVIVPFHSDHILVQEASYPFLRALIKKGASIHQYMNGFYHAKVLIVDEETCDLGTANFDKRSFFLNSEINCFIYDRSMIDGVITIIKKDLKDSRKISLKDVSPTNIFQSIKESIAKGISDFL